MLDTGKQGRWLSVSYCGRKSKRKRVPTRALPAFVPREMAARVTASRRCLPLMLLAGEVAGHGWMTHPPSRNGGNLSTGGLVHCVGGTDLSPDCNWFTSETYIPGEPTLCDPELLTVLDSIEHNCSADHLLDFTRKHPWRAPGTAPLIHPCGTHCTSMSSESCYWGNVAGPIWGKDHENQVNWTSLPKSTPTEWKRGTSVEVGAGIAILHSGGWSYRLCSMDSELTEECFQAGTLLFNSDSAKVQPTDGSASPFTIPVRHTPDRKWTKIPLPATNTEMPAPWCKSPFIELQKEMGANWKGGDVDRYLCNQTTGKCAEGDDWCWKYGKNVKGFQQCCDCKTAQCLTAQNKPAFEPPKFPASFKHAQTDGNWNFTIIETVDIPVDLPTGAKCSPLSCRPLATVFWTHDEMLKLRQATTRFRGGGIASPRHRSGSTGELCHSTFTPWVPRLISVCLGRPLVVLSDLPVLRMCSQRGHQSRLVCARRQDDRGGRMAE